VSHSADAQSTQYKKRSTQCEHLYTCKIYIFKIKYVNATLILAELDKDIHNIFKINYLYMLYNTDSDGKVDEIYGSLKDKLGAFRSSVHSFIEKNSRDLELSYEKVEKALMTIGRSDLVGELRLQQREH